MVGSAHPTSLRRRGERARREFRESSHEELSRRLRVAGRHVRGDTPVQHPTELQRLQGVWVLVSEIEDGKATPAAEAKEIKLTFDDAGKWKVEVKGKLVGEGTAVLDTTKK